MPEIPLKPEDQELCRIHDYEFEQWGEKKAQQKNNPAKSKTQNNEANAKQQEEKLEYPSIEELQKIREEAFNEGFATGYKEGLAKGKKEGEIKGIEEGKQKGFEQGKEQGFTQGKEEGFVKSKQEVDSTFLKKYEKQHQLWQLLIDRLTSSINEQDSLLKKSMTQLIMQICRQVFVTEMSLKPEHIQYVVKHVLDALPNDEQKLQIFINSDDHAELEKVMQYHPNELMHYQIDDELQSGGCYVKAKYSYVDYTLTKRFQSQIKELMESVPDLDWDDLINLRKPLKELEDFAEDDVSNEDKKNELIESESLNQKDDSDQKDRSLEESELNEGDPQKTGDIQKNQEKQDVEETIDNEIACQNEKQNENQLDAQSEDDQSLNQEGKKDAGRQDSREDSSE